MAPKTIRSQYHSTCRVCDGHIRPGDTIEWARGTKPAHIECAQPATQPATQPQQPQYPTDVQSVIDTVGQVTRERDAALLDGRTLRALVGQQQAEIERYKHVLETARQLLAVTVRERDAARQELDGRCGCIAAAPVAEIHAEESGSIEGDAYQEPPVTDDTCGL